MGKPAKLALKPIKCPVNQVHFNITAVVIPVEATKRLETPCHFSLPFVTLVISVVTLGSEMKGPAALPLSTLLSRLPFQFFFSH